MFTNVEHFFMGKDKFSEYYENSSIKTLIIPEIFCKIFQKNEQMKNRIISLIRCLIIKM